jgi:hypothetical protein
MITELKKRSGPSKGYRVIGKKKMMGDWEKNGILKFQERNLIQCQSVHHESHAN